MTRLRYLWLSVLLALAACGGSEPPATQAPAKPASVASATPSSSSTPASAAAAPTAADGEAPTQISETDEESTDDPVLAPVATPTLRMVAAPKALPPSRFQEGVHYQRLSPTQPTDVSPGQIEVAEVFWYGCAACFSIDPKLERWRTKGKPSFVVFERIPATTNEIARFHARVFYAAEALGKLDALHTGIYREIHVANNPLNTVDSVSAFFAAFGVNKTDFQTAFASPAVESKLRHADILNRRYRVQNTPYFVVNGKFTTDVTMAGGEDELLTLLSELATRERDY